MPPRKKQKTLRDFTLVLSTISNHYEEKGDVGRSRSFSTASTNLCAFADVTNKKLDAPLKSSEDFKDVKGVGKSTLEMLDEFIKTGTCSRLDELEDKQVALIHEEQKSLELGVFNPTSPEDSDYDKEMDELYLYEDGDERALYDDAKDHFDEYITKKQMDRYHNYDGSGGMDDVTDEIIERFAGFERLTAWYSDIPDAVHFVRKATEADLTEYEVQGTRYEFENWKTPTGVTREELRDLVRKGKYTKQYEEAFNQLIEEEKEFLELAKFDVRTALDVFPYEHITYRRSQFFDFLCEDTLYDLDDGSKACVNSYGDEFRKLNPDVRHYKRLYKLFVRGKKCYVALREYDSNKQWYEDDACFSYSEKMFPLDFKYGYDEITWLKPSGNDWLESFKDTHPGVADVVEQLFDKHYK